MIVAEKREKLTYLCGISTNKTHRQIIIDH